MLLLASKSFRLYPLPLLAALALATQAMAADVSVQLGSGDGFVVKDSTGSIQRLRVDEATGNVSRNGALFVHTTGIRQQHLRRALRGEHSRRPATSTPPSATSPSAATPAASPTPPSAALTLFNNTTGSGNSAFGSPALSSNTTGYWNSAFGS